MRNNIPIIGESKPTLAGQPIIRIEVRIAADGKFLAEVQLRGEQENKTGWLKSLTAPEVSPDAALLAAHLAVIRKLSQPPE
jgi:hypothetical protein